MPGHMDPATGKWIDDDQQPDPNAGGLAGQQQDAAALSPAPIPPAGPTVAMGEPTIISPSDAAAPGVDTPPPDGGMKLPEPTLPLPGAPGPAGLTLSPMPPVGGPGGSPPPGGDLVPAPIPAGADAVLGLSAEPPKPLDASEPPADTIEGRNKQLADISKEQIDTRQAKAEDEKAQADVRAAALKERAGQLAEYKKANDAISRAAENRLAASRAKHAADEQKYQELGAKDAWGDNATGLKVLAGIALALGGRRAAPYIIGAANGFEANKKEALAMQAEKMKASGKDVDDVRTEMNDQIADLSARKSAGLEASAARLDAELAARGLTKPQRDANADILELRKAAVDARQAADVAAHKQAEADAKEQKTLLKIDASTRLDTLRGDQIAKKMAGGGAGGGSAGADGATKLAKLIEDGAQDADGTRRPLTQSEVYSAAKGLGIPPTAKAGRTSVETVMKGSAFNANQARKDALAGRQDNKQIIQQADGWAKENGLTQIAKQQRELGSLQKQLTDNANNPLNQALAVEKAVSAARGGAASKQALALALEHMGGSLDNAEGIIQKWRDGQLPEGKRKNFIDFLNGQRGAAQEEGAKAYSAFNDYIDNAPPEQRKALATQRARLFSGMDGFGGRSTEGPKAPAAKSSAPTASPAARAKLIVNDPTKRSLYTDAQWAQLIQASRGK